MAFFDFLKKKPSEQEEKDALNHGLEKTRTSFLGKLGRIVAGKSEVDDDFLDELEEVLITSDVGLKTTLKIIDRLKTRAEKDKYINKNELQTFLKDEISKLLTENKEKGAIQNNFKIESITKENPLVLMVVGVNGVGKTTTIGKLAHQFKQAGAKVLLAAGDTFRAGAVDQLKIWSERADVDFYSQGMNTDPAAVAFEAVKKGKEEGYDIIILDTAGRLHNKINLMNELAKIKRVMSKIIPEAPHEVMLVLDASTGQNAFEQADKFTQATEVTSLALTKLDGTAKGGVVIGISDSFGVPVKYIGVGEKMEDLRIFAPVEFIESLFYESKIS
ncbi:MAG: signal recognition particle-docking protein FtsY [Bacteroidia bacterium]|jgi:fused signal recognition particle receptor|nr:signal recognition particle-docking protein FtsY [Bacteroidia bacterium]MCO5253665.1 signal recognition particle-docking protein FtsY [Bacteroidota bacterium]MCZ2129635.1 signal recognition particle-docking protein FtsY [Bacteroidia bacterium]